MVLDVFASGLLGGSIVEISAPRYVLFYGPLPGSGSVSDSVVIGRCNFTEPGWIFRAVGTTAAGQPISSNGAATPC
ncbi:hypothetical protein [Desertimonas flava]|uniref:hypothetical protein n=1 Tax=Desertimonas flava TaxID=2064846 RepID=UPI000E34B383|nr:hypothetical protein [Desertimonas flava]